MLFWQALSYRFGKSEVKTKPPSGWKEALSLAYLMHGAELYYREGGTLCAL